MISRHWAPCLKLVSIEDAAGKMRDTIKLSNNAEKVSTPGKSRFGVLRVKMMANLKAIMLPWQMKPLIHNEVFICSIRTFRTSIKRLKILKPKPLLQTIYDKGQQVYHTPPLQEVQAYATRSTNALWDEYRRILNPQDYPVDLSQRVWDNKMDLIKAVKSAVADREE